MTRSRIALLAAVLLTAFAFAILGWLRAPLAPMDARSLGRVVGGSLALLALSAIVPCFVWMFSRFRARNATLPLGLWLICCIGLGVFSERPRAVDDRKVFLEAAGTSCRGSLQQNRSTTGIEMTDVQIDRYCACSVGKMDAIVTPGDLREWQTNGGPPDRFQAAVNQIGQACLESVLGR